MLISTISYMYEVDLTEGYISCSLSFSAYSFVSSPAVVRPFFALFVFYQIYYKLMRVDLLDKLYIEFLIFSINGGYRGHSLRLGIRYEWRLRNIRLLHEVNIHGYLRLDLSPHMLARLLYLMVPFPLY